MMKHAQNIKDPREVALLALHATEKQGGWSDAILKKLVQSLDTRDSALATRLCFGVLQNRGLIDFYLSQFSKMPLKKMEHLVLQNLRLGIYQILFMDKIPHNASVDSAVNLTKKHCKNPKAAGMVNGILRNFIRQIDHLPEIPQERTLEALSISYSHPLWLVELFSKEMSETDLRALLEANNQIPPITAMVNTVKAGKLDVIKSLEEENVSVTLHPWLENCLILSHTGNIEKLTAFAEGMLYIQDPASRLAAEASGVATDANVLDCCAAPGGKSMALAIKMEDQGKILSCDLHPHKKKLIAASAKRLHLESITAEIVNAKDFTPQFVESFDLVFADVPCSGLGVIAKKPDIRYKEAENLADLPQIQKDILANVSQYVKPGGVLIYSTCTVLKRENQDVVFDFLKQNPQFVLESFSLPKPIGEVKDGFITFYPHQFGTDGFFIAKFRKQ